MSQPEVNNEQTRKTEEGGQRQNQRLDVHQEGGLGRLQGESPGTGDIQNSVSGSNSECEPSGAIKSLGGELPGGILSQLRSARETQLAYVDAHRERLEARLAENKAYREELVKELDELEQKLANLVKEREESDRVSVSEEEISDRVSDGSDEEG